ncbi:hypothetical protein CIPAW_08G138400 [Carya illinoinensis]|uniref:Uncharacterized protein n=1 Tax=Carya illinoinensis TaxID=32201 RepID=A0A8T1PMM6_CARIL|nr:hypothetical protein CIPAW_08G138400 [Carya illinoinensis]
MMVVKSLIRATLPIHVGATTLSNSPLDAGKTVGQDEADG